MSEKVWQHTVKSDSREEALVCMRIGRVRQPARRRSKDSPSKETRATLGPASREREGSWLVRAGVGSHSLPWCRQFQRLPAVGPLSSPIRSN